MRSSQTKQKRFIFKSRKLSHDCCFKFNIVANIETIQQSLAIYQDVGIIDGRNPHSDISRAKFPMVRNSIITSSRLSTFVSVSMGARVGQRSKIWFQRSKADPMVECRVINSSTTSTPTDRCGSKWRERGWRVEAWFTYRGVVVDCSVSDQQVTAIPYGILRVLARASYGHDHRWRCDTSESRHRECLWRTLYLYINMKRQEKSVWSRRWAKTE